MKFLISRTGIALTLLILTITCTPIQKIFKRDLSLNTRIQDSLAAVIANSISDSIASLPDSAEAETEAESGYQPSITRQHDLIHTRLEASLDWNQSELIGNCVLTLKPYAYPSDKLYLNARGMLLQSVSVYENTPFATNECNTVTSKALSQQYEYKNDSICIHLGKTFQPGETFQVQIRYIASPEKLSAKNTLGPAITDDKGLYFINPKNENPFKMKQVWTQGETQSNSVWMPTIDVPNEKMTQDFFITVTQSLVTLSNGRLVKSIPAAGGTRTDHWQMSKPHAPYLAMFAAGNFKIVKDPGSKTLPVSYYVEPEYENQALFMMGHTPEMIAFFSNLLKTPYPWAKYDQIVVRDFVSGAMENTSATLHGDFMIYQTQEDREIQGESVISHELFHQWFGDLVTCESWSHLPLNESFATYGEYLWQEHKYGRDAADLHQRESRNNYFGTYSNGDDRSPINFYYQNREKMFDAISYNKGGLILHSLRKTLGDSVFFKGLNLYLNRHAYKTVEIHDLRLALEEVSGTDLNWFFNQWFLSPGLALMSVQKRYDAEQKMLVLECTQLQENPLALILPLDIDVYAGGKINRERIWMRKRHEIFQISCSSPPDWVNVDAENQIVGYIYPYTLETENVFAFQNAPLAEDRIDAALAISSQIDQPDIRNLFLNAAENDPSKDLRLLCWELLAPDSLIESDKLPKSLLPKLKSVLKKENDAAIRAYLSKMQLHLINDPIDVITECYTQLKDTSTYWIGYYAFNYLNTHNVSSKELLVATRALTWQNETMVSLKLNVLSELGDSTDIPYFLSLLKKPGMYDLKNWIQMPYIKFANRIKNPQMFYEYTRALFPFFKYLKNTSMDAKTLESYQNTIDSVYSNTKSNFEIYKAQNNLNANLKLQLEYAEKLKALFDGL